MGVLSHDITALPPAELLQHMERRSGLSVPTCRGMPQVVRTKILNHDPPQRRSPSLRIDLAYRRLSRDSTALEILSRAVSVKDAANSKARGHVGELGRFDPLMLGSELVILKPSSFLNDLPTRRERLVYRP
jgi:hypothetical protein